MQLTYKLKSLKQYCTIETVRYIHLSVSAEMFFWQTWKLNCTHLFYDIAIEPFCSPFSSALTVLLVNNPFLAVHLYTYKTNCQFILDYIPPPRYPMLLLYRRVRPLPQLGIIFNHKNPSVNKMSYYPRSAHEKVIK